jgi:hypothetical protein
MCKHARPDNTLRTAFAPWHPTAADRGGARLAQDGRIEVGAVWHGLAFSLRVPPPLISYVRFPRSYRPSFPKGYTYPYRPAQSPLEGL